MANHADLQWVPSGPPWLQNVLGVRTGNLLFALSLDFGCLLFPTTSFWVLKAWSPCITDSNVHISACMVDIHNAVSSARLQSATKGIWFKSCGAWEVFSTFHGPALSTLYNREIWQYFQPTSFCPWLGWRCLTGPHFCCSQRETRLSFHYFNVVGTYYLTTQFY